MTGYEVHPGQVGCGMTISLDPNTEACLRAIAEKEHLPVETWLTYHVSRCRATSPTVFVRPEARREAFGSAT